MPEKFNLEEQFQLYLQRMGLNPEVMDAVQLRERKMAFMAGISQLLMFTIEKADKEPEDDGVAYIDDVWNQLQEYWKSVTKTVK